MKECEITADFFARAPKSRLITIKSGTRAETKIKGYNNFKMHVKGPESAIALLLNSGVGLYNAMGMGCVEMVV